MFPMKKSFLVLLILFFLLNACATENDGSATPVSSTSTPRPSPTATRTVPTAAIPGNAVVWDQLEVRMDRFEMTDAYLTDFDSKRTPPTGKKFLWVHIGLKNLGQTGIVVPLLENYSILYAATEIKPIYGHRQNYFDYSTLGPTIFPGQELDGWLRFDVPLTAEASDLRFVFLPESNQVGVSYNSPYYPFAEDKPTYLWELVP